MNNPVLQFRILGQRIRVRCDDELLKSLILANYGAFLEPDGHDDSAELEYTVGKHPSGGFYISRGNETLVEETSDEAIQYTVVYFLEKLITLDLQHLRTDLYFVHSAALERNGGVIIIAADSGTGNSTTAWSLLQHGFNLDVHPYPHALCLKAPPPGPYPLPENTVRTERTLHIPTTSLPASIIKQPKPLRALIFLQRDANTPTAPTFEEVSSAEAGARLYANTLNALAHPGSGLDVAIKVASTVPAYTLHAGELQATCEVISKLEEQLEQKL
jgi:hypothetical protein